MRSKEVWRTCVILAYSSDVNKQHVQCTDVDTIRCIWSMEDLMDKNTSGCNTAEHQFHV